MLKKTQACLLFLIFGCSHQSSPVKTVYFPYAPELLQTILKDQPKRGPASLNLDEVKEEKSTRRVYFSTLYYQHLVLGSHLQKNNEINSCPQFHHDKVETDSYVLPKVTPYRTRQVAEDGKNYFPELVFDGKFSIEDYHLSLREELEILCEDGYSDNYFKFDNLITHHANKLAFHNKPSAMESVLKIPIFANFYLIKMIESRREENMFHPEEKLFIQMSQTHWFDQYINEASRLRTNFLRDKMVRR
jgi:hypothetical protein